MDPLKSIRREIKRLRQSINRTKDYRRFQRDPAGYCRKVLKVELTQAQEEICRSVVEPPFKVLVRAAHNVGKSFLAACLVNWWFDVHPDGIVLTTAPTARQVQSILWKEIRRLRGRRGGFPGPKICRLESSESHFAEGFTARDSTRFQGFHGTNVFIVFDEAEGVELPFWEAMEPMLGGDNYGFLGIYNPTSQSSPTVAEERSGKYTVKRMSSLDHPNIAAELAGCKPPYPSAIRLGRLKEMLSRWSQEVEGEPGPEDVRLDGKWYHPGPVAQARLLGIRPSLGFDSVWSEMVFEKACSRELPVGGLLQIGCDVARFGDDDTAWHVRRGGNSRHHESANGLNTVQVANRCKDLADRFGREVGVEPKRVLIAVDDCGVGGGVTDQLQASGWNAYGVNVATEAPDDTEYPNLRSCLWFGLAEAAADGNLSFAHLPDGVKQDLRNELLAPKYTMDVRGRRVVEPKQDTKDRTGRSPDNADAAILAYTNVNAFPEQIGQAVRVP